MVHSCSSLKWPNLLYVLKNAKHLTLITGNCQYVDHANKTLCYMLGSEQMPTMYFNY